MGKDDDPDMDDSEKRNNFSENCSDEATNTAASSETEIKNEASQLCDEENLPGMYVELLSIENAIKNGVVEKSSLEDNCVNKHRTLSRLTNGLNTSFNSDCDLSTDNNFEFLKCGQNKSSEENISENVILDSNKDIIFKTECVSDDLAVNYLNAEFVENEGMWRLDWFIENTCDAAMAPVNQDDFIVLCYTAEALEKRWVSLRDMFSRETRKKKFPPSGSEYIKKPEWHLYKTMEFLLPHIQHRRSKDSLMMNAPSTSTQANNTLEIEELEADCEIAMCFDEVASIDDSTSIDDSASTPSLTSPTPTTLKRSVSLERESIKKFKKVTRGDDSIEEATASISKAMDNIAEILHTKSNRAEEGDGYYMAIKEGLKYVPPRDKTKCLIEVLQVIQKYEVRE